MIEQKLVKHLRQFTDEVEDRVRQGIQTHRMGFGTIKVVDGDGNPVEDAEIKIEQTRHEFWFGCNTFMLKGYDSDELNHLYEDRFRALFNLTVVPFYWSDLEPEDGKVRFAADSPFIFRRPPPDLVLDWAEANGITTKGHTLIWDRFYPEWLPKNRKELADRIRRRFREIAERYSDRIKIWDVVNESLQRDNDVLMPRDYVFWAFQQAAEFFPTTNQLILNEATPYSWGSLRSGRPCPHFVWDESPFYLLNQNLLLRNAQLGGIGLQFHMFQPKEDVAARSDLHLNPTHLFNVMDQYARLGLPLQISEITIPAYQDLPNGEELQAEITRALYRVWFSHPSVEAIVWWNLPDGQAHRDEGHYRPGLVREDMSPKPVYEAMDSLINDEWRTRLTLNGSMTAFKGFYGDYTATCNGQTTAFKLSKDSPNEVTVVVA